MKFSINGSVFVRQLKEATKKLYTIAGKSEGRKRAKFFLGKSYRDEDVLMRKELIRAHIYERKAKRHLQFLVDNAKNSGKFSKSSKFNISYSQKMKCEALLNAYHDAIAEVKKSMDECDKDVRRDELSRTMSGEVSKTENSEMKRSELNQTMSGEVVSEQGMNKNDVTNNVTEQVSTISDISNESTSFTYPNPFKILSTPFMNPLTLMNPQVKIPNEQMSIIPSIASPFITDIYGNIYTYDVFGNLCLIYQQPVMNMQNNM